MIFITKKNFTVTPPRYEKQEPIPNDENVAKNFHAPIYFVLHKILFGKNLATPRVFRAQKTS